MPCPRGPIKIFSRSRSRTRRLSQGLSLSHRGFRRVPFRSRPPILLEALQQAAQRLEQFVAANIAFPKLKAQPERLVLRMIAEDERLGPRAGIFLFLTFSPRLIARQPALRDAMDRFEHLPLVWLPRNLQE